MLRTRAGRVAAVGSRSGAIAPSPEALPKDALIVPESYPAPRETTLHASAPAGPGGVRISPVREHGPPIDQQDRKHHREQLLPRAQRHPAAPRASTCDLDLSPQS